MQTLRNRADWPDAKFEFRPVSYDYSIRLRSDTAQPIGLALKQTFGSPGAIAKLSIPHAAFVLSFDGFAPLDKTALEKRLPEGSPERLQNILISVLAKLSAANALPPEFKDLSLDAVANVELRDETVQQLLGSGWKEEIASLIRTSDGSGKISLASGEFAEKAKALIKPFALGSRGSVEIIRFAFDAASGAVDLHAVLHHRVTFADAGMLLGSVQSLRKKMIDYQKGLLSALDEAHGGIFKNPLLQDLNVIDVATAAKVAQEASTSALAAVAKVGEALSGATQGIADTANAIQQNISSMAAAVQRRAGLGIDPSPQLNDLRAAYGQANELLNGANGVTAQMNALIGQKTGLLGQLGNLGDLEQYCGNHAPECLWRATTLTNPFGNLIHW